MARLKAIGTAPHVTALERTQRLMVHHEHRGSWDPTLPHSLVLYWYSENSSSPGETLPPDASSMPRPPEMSLPQIEESHSSKDNIARALQQIQTAGGDSKQSTYTVDCDASKDCMKWMKERTPCITRSRYKGHWVTRHERRLTLLEMFRLQGMDHTKVTPRVHPHELGKQNGNSMSVNVVEVLVRAALQGTGDLSMEVPDAWDNHTAIKRLFDIRGKASKYVRVSDQKNKLVRLNQRWLSLLVAEHLTTLRTATHSPMTRWKQSRSWSNRSNCAQHTAPSRHINESTSTSRTSTSRLRLLY